MSEQSPERPMPEESQHEHYTALIEKAIEHNADVPVALHLAAEAGMTLTPDQFERAFAVAQQKGNILRMYQAAEALHNSELLETTLRLSIEHIDQEFSLEYAQDCLREIGRDFTEEELEQLVLNAAKKARRITIDKVIELYRSHQS